MDKERQAAYIESIKELFIEYHPDGTEDGRLFIDGEIYTEVLTFLAQKAVDAKNKNLRAAYEKALDDLLAPVTNYMEARAGVAESTSDYYKIDHVLKISENLADRIISALSIGCPLPIDRLPVERQLFPTDRVFSELRKPDTIVTPEEIAKDPDKGNPIPILHGPAKQPNKFNDWALFTIDLEGDENIKLKSPDRLTNLESICYFTIFSVIDAGNSGFLLEDLGRIMFGKKEGAISESALDDIEDAIKKLSRIDAEIDFTDSLRNSKKKYVDDDGNEITEYHTEGKLLNYKVETYVNRKGTAKRYFRLLDVPDLYKYSKLTGRIISIPREVMDIREISADGSPGAKIPLRMSRGLPLLFTLARRVGIIQREAEKVRDKYRKQFKSNGQLQKSVTKEKTPEELWKETSGINAPYRILFDSLAEDAELETTKTESAKKKFRHDVQEICSNILEYWTAIGFIDGYKIVKRGRSNIGIDIIFNGINGNSRNTRSVIR